MNLTQMWHEYQTSQRGVDTIRAVSIDNPDYDDLLYLNPIDTGRHHRAVAERAAELGIIRREDIALATAEIDRTGDLLYRPDAKPRNFAVDVTTSNIHTGQSGLVTASGAPLSAALVTELHRDANVIDYVGINPADDDDDDDDYVEIVSVVTLPESVRQQAAAHNVNPAAPPAGYVPVNTIAPTATERAALENARGMTLQAWQRHQQRLAGDGDDGDDDDAPAAAAAPSPLVPLGLGLALLKLIGVF